MARSMTLRVLSFRPDEEDYLVHITTGTHVQQICLFLLTESRHFPARLVQTAPSEPKRRGPDGKYSIIDLDLSKYDRIAARFQREEQRDAASFLKSGIETRNPRFNQLIEEIEHVAIHAKEPILLMGPTGAGKSQLARRIFELKRSRAQVAGALVEVNCATLRGESAMSTLFGHIKGPLRGRLRIVRACFVRRTEASFSWTRWGNWDWMSRPCSCGRWRRNGSFLWAVIEKRTATFNSSRAPIVISPPLSGKARFREDSAGTDESLDIPAAGIGRTPRGHRAESRLRTGSVRSSKQSARDFEQGSAEAS